LRQKLGTTNIKIFENPSNRSRFVPLGQTDVTKQNVAFRSSVKATGCYSGPLGLQSKPTSM